MPPCRAARGRRARPVTARSAVRARPRLAARAFGRDEVAATVRCARRRCRAAAGAPGPGRPPPRLPAPGSRVPLRPGIVVVCVVLHRPQQHHGVILVNRVVAVHRIVAAEVPEAHHQLDLLVETQLYDILPGEFDVPRLDQLPVAPDDLELLQVNVDGVLPAAGVVLQDPPFRRVTVHREPDLVAVHEAPVDLPLAVAPLEAEPA